MVLIVGSLHSYLAALLEDWADRLVDDWNALSLLQKRYVVLHVRRSLARLLVEIPESELWEERALNRFRISALRVGEWLQRPTVLAASPDREELTGFFRDLGAKAIERALSRFRGDGIPFFGWLVGLGRRYDGYRDRLDEAITIRNEVAHGILNRRVTVKDVRDHFALVTEIVRKAEEFVR
jgi:hypothetical protein